MFDDIPNKNSNVPPNLPTEPMDMFAGVEEDAGQTPGLEEPSALEAGILKKRTTPVQVPPAMMAQEGAQVNYPTKAPVLGKIIGFVVFLVVAAVVGYGGWRLYAYLTQKEAVTPETNGTAQQPATEEPATEEPSEVTETATPGSITAPIVTTTVTTGQVEFGETIDTDKDGLDDTREEEAKTNMNNPDTDEDGLTDGDEVIIWKTNPLNPDTDGDSYLDGDEVKHGYNPLGSGKLFGNGQNGTTSPTVGSTSTMDISTTTVTSPPADL